MPARADHGRCFRCDLEAGRGTQCVATHCDLHHRLSAVIAREQRGLYPDPRNLVEQNHHPNAEPGESFARGPWG